MSNLIGWWGQEMVLKLSGGQIWMLPAGTLVTVLLPVPHTCMYLLGAVVRWQKIKHRRKVVLNLSLRLHT